MANFDVFQGDPPTRAQRAQRERAARNVREREQALVEWQAALTEQLGRLFAEVHEELAALRAEVDALRGAA